MKKKAYLNCVIQMTAILILLPVTAGIAAARQADNAEASPWSGDIELGYLMTSGNSDTQSLNARLRILREVSRWRHQLQLESLYNSETREDTDEDETTAQKFLASAKTNLKFDSKNSAFLLGIYEDDRFSGYDYQATVAAGYSRVFIDTDRLTLTGEIGPGWRYSKLHDQAADGKDSETEAIVRLAGLFDWQVSQNAVFAQELSIEAGEDKTITRSATSLKTRVIGALALKASFALKHTDNVPADTDKTDTETALTLVYSF